MRSTSTTFLALALVLAACSSGDPPADSPEPAERERTVFATLELEVAAIDDATASIREAVAAEDGYVASIGSDDRAAHLEIRVAADHLDALRESLAALGRATHTSERVEDVTLAHADQQAQLASARAEETRLTAMFADRTASLADVLAVEHELARVSAEIARLDAEERATRDAVRMAHLSLDLVQASRPFTDDPIEFVCDAARAGATTTWGLVVLGAGVAAALAPAAMVVALFVLIVRALARFVRRRQAPSPSTP